VTDLRKRDGRSGCQGTVSSEAKRIVIAGVDHEEHVEIVVWENT